MQMNRLPLTPGQSRFYSTLKNYITKNGVSPSIPELQLALGVSSIRSVTQYLDALQRKGYITRSKFQKRSIQLIGDERFTTVQLPVLSAAGCDTGSIVAEQIYDEHIDVNKDILGRISPTNVVAIRAIGHSMVDAGIDDGDYVLTEKTQDAHEGDLVVAVVDGMAVIKKVSFTNNAIILSPMSPDPQYRPIIAHQNFQIFGKVIMPIKMPKVAQEIRYVKIKGEDSNYGTRA